MTSVCKLCELKSKYKYWNELPPIKKSFFKVMYDNFHDQMRIPKEFMTYFNGKLGEWCILRGPSGKEWRVRKTQESGITLISDGWDTFVDDNGIMSVDFLVFSYCGDSSFQVSIYKMSGCERESAYFADNSSSSTSPGMCFTSLHTHTQAQQDHANASFYESEGSDDDDDNNDSVSLCLSGESSKNDKWKSPKNIEELDGGRKRRQGSTSRGHKQPQTVHVSRRKAVTWAEEQRANNSASNYVVMNEDSGRPMIMLTMFPTHVYQGFHLTVPKKWAKQHLHQVDHAVKLRVPGTEGGWVIGCRWTSKLQCQFISGWSNFVFDNNLEDHDVCVLELVRKGDLNKRKSTTFDVHIFRVVDQVVPLKKVRISN